MTQEAINASKSAMTAEIERLNADGITPKAKTKESMSKHGRY
jgi:hypothetical protein